MTTEEKAKAYDEVRKKIALRFGSNVVEEIFSEFEMSDDERMVKFIKKQLFNVKKTITENYEFDAKLTKATEWLEKQGEQKPTDKVVPKFKIGDWVVTSYGKVNQVVAVDEDGDGFTLDDNTYFSGSWKDGYHLWTIQDAKDGDALYSSEHNLLWIYKNKEECHTSANLNYANSISFGTDIVIPFDVCPATKEQRELLFQKMREAGYEWDEEKKELRKIEQKPKWSDDDEENLQHSIAAIHAAEYYTLEDKNEMEMWLKSLKQRMEE